MRMQAAVSQRRLITVRWNDESIFECIQIGGYVRKLGARILEMLQLSQGEVVNYAMEHAGDAGHRECVVSPCTGTVICLRYVAFALLPFEPTKPILP